MKKLLLLFCLILQIFTLGGCKGEPFIVFSAQDPKNGLNKNQIEYNFKKEQPIYYAIISPKGFEDDILRISLTKKDTKTEFGGYTNYRNKTVKLNRENYYSDYYIIREEGIFVMQAFSVRNLNKAIATGIFRVYAN